MDSFNIVLVGFSINVANLTPIIIAQK